MASLMTLADELLLMVADEMTDFKPEQRISTLYALALTNRRLYTIFDPLLYKFDAKHTHKAVAWGALAGSAATIDKAVAQGADVDVLPAPLSPEFRMVLGSHSPNRGRPIHFAVAMGHNAIIDQLRANNAWLNRESSPFLGDIQHHRPYLPRIQIYRPSPVVGWRLLYWAIHYNQTDTVRHLLELGVGPLLSTNARTLTPMHVAAALAREDMFDMFLALPGSDINAVDNDGNTPLHHAARGFYDVDLREIQDSSVRSHIIVSLLGRGADPSISNRAGMTPLLFALSWKQPQWAAALVLLDTLPAGFVPSDLLITTAVASAHAAALGESEMLGDLARKEVLRRLLTPQVIDRLYRTVGTPLKLGCHDVWTWLDKQVTPLIWSILQRRPINLNPSRRDNKAIEMLPGHLLNCGANPSQADARGRTPLHACIYKALVGEVDGQDHGVDMMEYAFDEVLGPNMFPYDVIVQLLSRGASLDALDDHGQTPLDYALRLCDTTLREVVCGTSESNWWQDPRYLAEMRRTSPDVLQMVHFVLQHAWQEPMCHGPSREVKTRLVHGFGLQVLAEEDPLGAELRGAGIGMNPTTFSPVSDDHPGYIVARGLADAIRSLTDTSKSG